MSDSSASLGFSTCDLCDAHISDDSSDFRVLPPVFHSYGGNVGFMGEVSTVQCLDDNSLVRAALAEPGGGRVLVVDGGGSLRRALVGGMWRHRRPRTAGPGCLSMAACATWPS